MNKDIKEILFDEYKLGQKVKELGSRISEDYKGKDLLVVGVLKGSVLFASDLIKNITIPCEIDFMAIKDGKRKYIQVTYELNDEKVIEREFGAFKTIEDNYPKYVISLDKEDLSQGNIKHINLIDFLMKDEF